MRILTGTTAHELVIKNSRFLAEAFAVDDPEAARAALRQRKEQYDCGHVVHAFICGAGNAVMGCSDDGEPPGTAGRPVLEVLKGSGLGQAMITVARWFGGVKLGTGGLVKAYTEAAQGVLREAPSAERISTVRYALCIPYPYFESARRILAEAGFSPESESFGETVLCSGTLPETAEADFLRQLTDLSRGRISASRIP